MPKILLVKTSSLGDVVHNLPVVSDIQRLVPDAVIDWVVEEAFADIPRMHPGVRTTLTVAIRRWRKQPFAAETRRQIGAAHAALRTETYDAIIDTQGLIKSALVARLARGRRFGLSGETAREPLAARFYDQGFAIPRNVHAVERNRWLAAAALDYMADGDPDYGIRATPLAAPWLRGAYAVLLHGTSRDDKLWPEADWVALGGWLRKRGIACILPWGNHDEEQRARRLATAIPSAMVAPRLTIEQAASLMTGAQLVVGTDTGLSHLAAALGKPVIALFCATDPALTGVFAGRRAINLGGRNQPPAVALVCQTATRLLL